MTTQPINFGMLIGKPDFRAYRLGCTLLGICLAVSLDTSNGARAAGPEQWGVWEMSWTGPREGNPYLEVELSVTFRQNGRRIAVPGFYDGDGVYKVRFSPAAQGPWRYETRSNRAELDGKSGSFTAGPPSADNHGPVEVFQTFYLRYADGSPYHQFGTTCYAWVHQTRELQQQTLKTLAASPFNKIRFCVFPVAYTYNTEARPQRVDLAGDRPYQVDLVDPWEMTTLPLGTAQPGEYTVQPAKPDLAYRFTPCAPGEKPRPDAKSATTGVESVSEE